MNPEVTRRKQLSGVETVSAKYNYRQTSAEVNNPLEKDMTSRRELLPTEVMQWERCVKRNARDVTGNAVLRGTLVIYKVIAE